MASNSYVKPNQFNRPAKKTLGQKLQFSNKTTSHALKCLLIIAIAVGSAAFVSIVKTKMEYRLNSQQQVISSVKKENDKLKQKINDRTSVESLNDFAADYGMATNEDNVKNINK